MQQPVSIALASPWQMEAIKRLLDRLPALLGHPNRVALLATPAADDVPGQFRLAGLAALLAAHGMTQSRPAQADAAIWLGDTLPEPTPRGLPVALLHWPAVGDAAAALPDPAHALFGLLDQHPRGEGMLAMPRDWSALLPASRLAPLRLASAGGPLARMARQRLLEAARRRLVAHETLVGRSIGDSIMAALLGRRFLTMPEQAGPIADYWARWGVAEEPAA